MSSHRLEIRLTDEELATLDAQRGLVPRATWAKAAVLSALNPDKAVNPPAGEKVAGKPR